MRLVQPFHLVSKKHTFISQFSGWSGLVLTVTHFQTACEWRVLDERNKIGKQMTIESRFLLFFIDFSDTEGCMVNIMHGYMCHYIHIDEKKVSEITAQTCVERKNGAQKKTKHGKSEGRQIGR